MTINDDLTYSLKQHTAYIKINRPPNNFFDATLIESIADNEKYCKFRESIVNLGKYCRSRNSFVACAMGEAQTVL